MSFKYCQSDIEMGGKCEQQCEHCREYYRPLEEYTELSPSIEADRKEVLMEQVVEYNYFEEENKLTRRLFNLDEVLDFCKTHRVEVLMLEDYQYGCFINAKPGDGCYATGLTPVYTMMCGIREYIKHKENEG